MQCVFISDSIKSRLIPVHKWFFCYLNLFRKERLSIIQCERSSWPMEFQNHDTAGDFFCWWIESNHEKEVKTHKEQKGADRHWFLWMKWNGIWYAVGWPKNHTAKRPTTAHKNGITQQHVPQSLLCLIVYANLTIECRIQTF